MPAAVFLDSVKYSEEPTNYDETLFNIFPNPAIEQLIIKPRIGFEAESRILIYDLIGKVLHEEYDKLSMGNEKIIDLRSFASGIYYIRITTCKEIFIENFIIIK
ncbi:T9SS type A sorting domain-containing protein [Bacteroidota bacterium]